jgi:hypothetical protein
MGAANDRCVIHAADSPGNPKSKEQPFFPQAQSKDHLFAIIPRVHTLKRSFKIGVQGSG